VTAGLRELVVHDWRSCDDTLPLERDEIHVWRIKQPLERGEIDLLMSFLSQDELARAQRFRFAEDQDRYVISRGALRAQLANYLGFDPKDLSFCYSQRGKPELASDFRDSDLRFNLAHSGEMIGYAFVHRRRIGIDVEKIRLDFPVHEIAARFFSEAERKALSRLPLPQRHAGFFRCWTRKEAYLKATGDGLSLPLNDFDVSLEPELPARLIATRPEQGEASKWQMESLDFGPNYAGALVVEAA
jgi:4'-phosphopantetheinyl transferase